jgi:hypothetical protein
MRIRVTHTMDRVVNIDRFEPHQCDAECAAYYREFAERKRACITGLEPVGIERTEIVPRKTVIFSGSAEAFFRRFRRQIRDVAGEWPATFLLGPDAQGTVTIELRGSMAVHRHPDPKVSATLTLSKRPAKTTDYGDKEDDGCIPFVDSYRLTSKWSAPYSVRGNDSPFPWGRGRRERV